MVKSIRSGAEDVHAARQVESSRSEVESLHIARQARSSTGPLCFHDGATSQELAIIVHTHSDITGA